MAKSNALQKLQSQKTNKPKVKSSKKEEVQTQKQPEVDGIMSMKVGELDHNHKHFDVNIEKWGDLDRTGKRQALLDHFYPLQKVVDKDLEKDLEEEAEEVKESPKGTKTGRDTTKKTNIKQIDKKTKKTKPKVNTSGEDTLNDIVRDIENISEEEADEKVHELKEGVEFNYFKLGGVLAVIKENKFIGEYSNFREKVEAEFGMKYRKADYLINIYLNIVDSGIEWDAIKDIGWTKLKFISHLLTPENVDMWAEKAKEMNTSTLEQEVKELNKTGSQTTSKTSKSEITNMGFRLHPDQRETIEAALDKSKEETETDVNAVALEAICLDYLSGGQKQVVIREPTVKQFFEQLMKKNNNDAEKALEALLESKDFESTFGAPIEQIEFT